MAAAARGGGTGCTGVGAGVGGADAAGTCLPGAVGISGRREKEAGIGQVQTWEVDEWTFVVVLSVLCEVLWLFQDLGWFKF